MGAMKNAAIEAMNHPRMDHRYSTAVYLAVSAIKAAASAVRAARTEEDRSWHRATLWAYASALRRLRISFDDWSVR